MAGMGFSELVLPGSSLFEPFGCCSGGFNFGHFTSPCPKKGLAVTNYKKKETKMHTPKRSTHPHPFHYGLMIFYRMSD
jgi:hypothetical protein